MAVDKLIKSLKNKIIMAYCNLIIKLQKGYTMNGHDKIIDAIAAIDFINTYEMTDQDKIKVLEYYILNLKDGK